MKKIFKLTKGTHHNEDEWQLKDKGFLCSSGLKEFFNISNKAKTLYVTVSDKEMLQSYEVKRMGGMFNELKLNIPDKVNRSWKVCLYTSSDIFLDREGLTDFYISIQYECD